MVTVHYFYDPMCGWCYGATALIEAVASNNKFNLNLHPGGMLPEKAIESSFRQHIVANDKQINQLTGAKFGQAYVDRVTNSDELILDSYLPIRAILVTESLGGNAFMMLKAIQKAHYVDGKSVNELSTLAQIAAQFEIDQQAWMTQMQTNAVLTQTAVDKSHQLMAKLQVQGYPTLYVEHKGELIKLPHTQYYGRQVEWQSMLENLTNK
ncbi:DsbA family protein [Shewanella sp. UCD-KL21]|uniref:DsbA family protein n=1 Tax=Shewanella sp. UCD-KL21 TaxID=1917164 RepID=UPI0009705D55|nr:DsbA family protein [Shewanella sp. UCD-KL21]